MQVPVAAQGFGDFPPCLREGWGVEDDEVVFGFVGTAKEVKNICLSGLNGESIACRIVAEASRTFHAGFHGGDVTCPCLGAGEREASLVGKAVQHGQPARKSRYDAIGLDLIQVKAGFVAAEGIDKESHT